LSLQQLPLLAIAGESKAHKSTEPVKAGFGQVCSGNYFRFGQLSHSRASTTAGLQLRRLKMTALRYETPSHSLIQDLNRLQANSKGALSLFREDAMNLTFVPLDDF
jgi:hypothetical protein